MKLGTLINNRDVLERLYKARVDGELETFDEARNEKIKELGNETEDGGAQIEPGSEAYQEVMQYLNEMAESEIEGPEAILTEDDLFSLDLSAEDIDKIEQLGLLKEG